MKPMHKRLAVLGLSSLLIAGAGSALAFGGHHDRLDCRGDGDDWRTPMMSISRLQDLRNTDMTSIVAKRETLGHPS